MYKNEQYVGPRFPPGKEFSFDEIFEEHDLDIKHNKFGLKRDMRFMSERIIMEYSPDEFFSVREIVHPMSANRTSHPFAQAKLVNSDDEYVTSLDFHEQPNYFPYAKSDGEVRLIRYISSFDDFNFAKLSTQHLFQLPGEIIKHLRHGRMDKGIVAMNHYKLKEPDKHTLTCFDLIRPKQPISIYHNSEPFNEVIWLYTNEVTIALADDRSIRITDIRDPKSYRALFLPVSPKIITTIASRVNEITAYAEGRILLFDVRRLDFPCRQYHLDFLSDEETIIDMRYNPFMSRKLAVQTSSMKLYALDIEDGPEMTIFGKHERVIKEFNRISFKHLDRKLYMRYHKDSRDKLFFNTGGEIDFLNYDEHYAMAKIDSGITLPSAYADPLSYNTITENLTEEQLHDPHYMERIRDAALAAEEGGLLKPKILHSKDDVIAFDFTYPGVSGIMSLRSSTMVYDLQHLPEDIYYSSVRNAEATAFKIRQMQVREMIPSYYLFEMFHRIEAGWTALYKETKLINLIYAICEQYRSDFWRHWLMNAGYMQYGGNEFRDLKEHPNLPNLPPVMPNLGVALLSPDEQATAQSEVLRMLSPFFHLFFPNPSDDMIQEEDDSEDGNEDNDSNFDDIPVRKDEELRFVTSGGYAVVGVRKKMKSLFRGAFMHRLSDEDDILHIVLKAARKSRNYYNHMRKQLFLNKKVFKPVRRPPPRRLPIPPRKIAPPPSAHPLLQGLNAATKEVIKLMYATEPLRMRKYVPIRLTERFFIEKLRSATTRFIANKRNTVMNGMYPEHNKNTVIDINEKHCADLKTAMLRARRSAWPTFYDFDFFYSKLCRKSQLLIAAANMYNKVCPSPFVKARDIQSAPAYLEKKSKTVRIDKFVVFRDQQRLYGRRIRDEALIKKVRWSDMRHDFDEHRWNHRPAQLAGEIICCRPPSTEEDDSEYEKDWEKPYKHTLSVRHYMKDEKEFEITRGKVMDFFEKTIMELPCGKFMQRKNHPITADTEVTPTSSDCERQKAERQRLLDSQKEAGMTDETDPPQMLIGERGYDTKGVYYVSPRMFKKVNYVKEIKPTIKEANPVTKIQRFISFNPVKAYEDPLAKLANREPLWKAMKRAKENAKKKRKIILKKRPKKIVRLRNVMNFLKKVKPVYIERNPRKKIETKKVEAKPLEKEKDSSTRSRQKRSKKEETKKEKKKAKETKMMPEIQAFFGAMERNFPKVEKKHVKEKKPDETPKNKPEMDLSKRKKKLTKKRQKVKFDLQKPWIRPEEPEPQPDVDPKKLEALRNNTLKGHRASVFFFCSSDSSLEEIKPKVETRRFDENEVVTIVSKPAYNLLVPTRYKKKKRVDLTSIDELAKRLKSPKKVKLKKTRRKREVTNEPSKNAIQNPLLRKPSQKYRFQRGFWKLLRVAGQQVNCTFDRPKFPLPPPPEKSAMKKKKPPLVEVYRRPPITMEYHPKKLKTLVNPRRDPLLFIATYTKNIAKLWNSIRPTDDIDELPEKKRVRLPPREFLNYFKFEESSGTDSADEDHQLINKRKDKTRVRKKLPNDLSSENSEDVSQESSSDSHDCSVATDSSDSTGSTDSSEEIEAFLDKLSHGFVKNNFGEYYPAYCSRNGKVIPVASSEDFSEDSSSNSVNHEMLKRSRKKAQKSREKRCDSMIHESDADSTTQIVIESSIESDTDCRKGSRKITRKNVRTDGSSESSTDTDKVSITDSEENNNDDIGINLDASMDVDLWMAIMVLKKKISNSKERKRQELKRKLAYPNNYPFVYDQSDTSYYPRLKYMKGAEKGEFKRYLDLRHRRLFSKLTIEEYQAKLKRQYIRRRKKMYARRKQSVEPWETHSRYRIEKKRNRKLKMEMREKIRQENKEKTKESILRVKKLLYRGKNGYEREPVTITQIDQRQTLINSIDVQLPISYWESKQESVKLLEFDGYKKQYSQNIKKKKEFNAYKKYGLNQYTYDRALILKKTFVSLPDVNLCDRYRFPVSFLRKSLSLNDLTYEENDEMKSYLSMEELPPSQNISENFQRWDVAEQITTMSGAELDEENINGDDVRALETESRAEEVIHEAEQSRLPESNQFMECSPDYCQPLASGTSQDVFKKPDYPLLSSMETVPYSSEESEKYQLSRYVPIINQWYTPIIRNIDENGVRTIIKVLPDPGPPRFRHYVGDLANIPFNEDSEAEDYMVPEDHFDYGRRKRRLEEKEIMKNVIPEGMQPEDPEVRAMFVNMRLHLVTQSKIEYFKEVGKNMRRLIDSFNNVQMLGKHYYSSFTTMSFEAVSERFNKMHNRVYLTLDDPPKYYDDEAELKALRDLCENEFALMPSRGKWSIKNVVRNKVYYDSSSQEETPAQEFARKKAEYLERKRKAKRLEKRLIRHEEQNRKKKFAKLLPNSILKTKTVWALFDALEFYLKTYDMFAFKMLIGKMCHKCGNNMFTYGCVLRHVSCRYKDRMMHSLFKFRKYRRWRKSEAVCRDFRIYHPENLMPLVKKAVNELNMCLPEEHYLGEIISAVDESQFITGQDFFVAELIKREFDFCEMIAQEDRETEKEVADSFKEAMLRDGNPMEVIMYQKRMTEDNELEFVKFRHKKTGRIIRKWANMKQLREQAEQARLKRLEATMQKLEDVQLAEDLKNDDDFSISDSGTNETVIFNKYANLPPLRHKRVEILRQSESKKEYNADVHYPVIPKVVKKRKNKKKQIEYYKWLIYDELHYLLLESDAMFSKEAVTDMLNGIEDDELPNMTDEDKVLWKKVRDKIEKPDRNRYPVQKFYRKAKKIRREYESDLNNLVIMRVHFNENEREILKIEDRCEIEEEDRMKIEEFEKLQKERTLKKLRKRNEDKFDHLVRMVKIARQAEKTRRIYEGKEPPQEKRKLKKPMPILRKCHRCPLEFFITVENLEILKRDEEEAERKKNAGEEDEVNAEKTEDAAKVETKQEEEKVVEIVDKPALEPSAEVKESTPETNLAFLDVYEEIPEDYDESETQKDTKNSLQLIMEERELENPPKNDEEVKAPDGNRKIRHVYMHTANLRSLMLRSYCRICGQKFPKQWSYLPKFLRLSMTLHYFKIFKPLPVKNCLQLVTLHMLGENHAVVVLSDRLINIRKNCLDKMKTREELLEEKRLARKRRALALKKRRIKRARQRKRALAAAKAAAAARPVVEQLQFAPEDIIEYIGRVETPTMALKRKFVPILRPIKKFFSRKSRDAESTVAAPQNENEPQPSTSTGQPSSSSVIVAKSESKSAPSTPTPLSTKEKVPVKIPTKSQSQGSSAEDILALLQSNPNELLEPVKPPAPKQPENPPPPPPPPKKPKPAAKIKDPLSASCERNGRLLSTEEYTQLLQKMLAKPVKVYRKRRRRRWRRNRLGRTCSWIESQVGPESKFNNRYKYVEMEKFEHKTVSQILDEKYELTQQKDPDFVVGNFLEEIENEIARKQELQKKLDELQTEEQKNFYRFAKHFKTKRRRNKVRHQCTPLKRQVKRILRIRKEWKRKLRALRKTEVKEPEPEAFEYKRTKPKRTLFEHFMRLSKKYTRQAIKDTRQGRAPLMYYGLKSILRHKMHLFMEYRRSIIRNFLILLHCNNIVWIDRNYFQMTYKNLKKDKVSKKLLKLRERMDVAVPLIAANALKTAIRRKLNYGDYVEIKHRVNSYAIQKSPASMRSWSADDFFKIRDLNRNRMLPKKFNEEENQRDTDVDVTPDSSLNETMSLYSEESEYPFPDQLEDNFWSQRSEQSLFNVKGIPGLFFLARLVHERVGEGSARNFKFTGIIFQNYPREVYITPVREMMCRSVGIRSPSKFKAAIVDSVTISRPRKIIRSLFEALCYGRGWKLYQMVDKMSLYLGEPLKSYRPLGLMAQTYVVIMLFKELYPILTGEDKEEFANELKDDIFMYYPDICPESESEDEETPGVNKKIPWTMKDWLGFVAHYLNIARKNERYILPEVIACLLFMQAVASNKPIKEFAPEILALKLPILLKLRFIINLSAHDEIVNDMMYLYGMVHGLDRLPFVGLGHHPDSMRVLFEESILHNDVQLLVHLMLIGQVLDGDSEVEMWPEVGTEHERKRNIADLIAKMLGKGDMKISGPPTFDQIFPMTFLPEDLTPGSPKTSKDWVPYLQCEITKYLVMVEYMKEIPTINGTDFIANGGNQEAETIDYEIQCNLCHTGVFETAQLGKIGEEITMELIEPQERIKHKKNIIHSRMCAIRDMENITKVPFVSPISQIDIKTERDLNCNHGGHVRHMIQWFETEKQCAVNLCECRCADLTYSYERIDNLKRGIRERANMRVKSHICNPECADTSSEDEQKEDDHLAL
ncbi:unnamed protein product [Caenorhabditis bovis]|uniref:WD repeat protein mio zinc-ribbon like domain-containing protein n=1 Tax=Caenorhabditis bovis TaxID=2654633 RepID=A0A8S1EDJ2_9PELO|nr:unnamed protein product [Caenorhabditis bovis]